MKTMTDHEVKVLMVGPKNSGKSALANFIADAVQNSENPAQAPTQPTKGCRIVEFDRKIQQKNAKVNVSALPCRPVGAKGHAPPAIGLVSQAKT